MPRHLDRLVDAEHAQRGGGHVGEDAALSERHALDAPRRPGIPLGNWRWLVRQRMAGVRDALVGEAAGSDDGWLAARGGSAFRERNSLLSRLSSLGRQILEHPDVEATRIDLKRLVMDIQNKTPTETNTGT